MSEDENDMNAADWWKENPREFVEKFQGLRRQPHFFILGPNHEIVPVRDAHEWARMFEDSKMRRVAQTSINGLWISTIFLGIDHRYGPGEPLFFETMIFRDQDNAPPEIYFEQIQNWCADYQMRYSTWDEAAKGHEQIVTVIREGLF
jgi:hypothetical protein